MHKALRCVGLVHKDNFNYPRAKKTITYSKMAEGLPEQGYLDTVSVRIGQGGFVQHTTCS